MTEKITNIEILYFDDCPSWKNAKLTLEKTLEKNNVSAEIQLISVETQASANENKFTGSPMIRINGNELFPTGQDNYGLGCRVFQTPDGMKGWPTENMLSEKINSLMN